MKLLRKPGATEASTEIIVVCVGCKHRESRPVDRWHPDRIGPWWLRADPIIGLGICSDCDYLTHSWDTTNQMAQAQRPAELTKAVKRRRIRRLWGIRHVRYWHYARQLRAWWEQYPGPGIHIHQADIDFLDAVWKGEA